MVITNLIGGLGNQMFQYAAGRALSLERGVPLRLDISGFANYGLHQGFELQRIFNCTAAIANEKDFRGVLGWKHSSGMRRLLSRRSMGVFRQSEFVVEPHFHYWREIKNLPRDCYLTGYWQSEQYFSEVISQLREDFTFRLPLASQNLELAKQINQVNAVSLHVRRGDYVNNPQTYATHGLCSMDYYSDAIRHISGKIDCPFFFVFSDDIEWAKENIKIDFPCQYVGHNRGAESYNDMRLMSLCRNHIIANSSFSWWGAWLNPRADKIIAAPKRWFPNQTDTCDLFPSSWITL